MAANNHVCSPFARIRFMERAESGPAYLKEAARNAWESGLFVKDRKGYDKAFYAQATQDLDQILPMDLDDFKNWAVREGWFNLEEKTIPGVGVEKVAAPNLAQGPEMVGYANALTKVYLEANAGGAKQLADNFLMKVKNGEDATTEGLAFARQMQGMARFGAAVMGMDQQLGRGLRQSGLIRDGRMPEMNVKGSPSLSADFTNNAKMPDALGNPGDYADLFQKIAGQLSDPLARQEGVDELVRLASRVQFLENPHQIGKAATAMELAGNAWSEVYMNGLLSGPATIVTNMLGGVWAVARPMLQLAAATAWETAAPDGQWKEAGRLAATEASAALAEMYTSFHDALRLGWHAARTERALYQEVRDPWISGEQLKATADYYGKSIHPGVADAFTQLGNLVRYPSRAQIGIDETLKHLTVRGQVAANAVRRASFEGIDLTDKDALRGYIDTEMKKAYNITPDALVGAGKDEADRFKAYIFKYNREQPLMPVADQSRIYAVEGAPGQRMAVMNRPLDMAAQAVFQEDNGMADAVQGLVSKYPAIRPFVPFVRTPLNIIRQGFVESTGLGPLVKGIGIVGNNLSNPTGAVLALQAELLKDPAQSARVAGQIGLTATLIGGIYTGVMSGQVTGGGPGRWTPGRNGKAAQDAWLAAGNIPYSVKVGDTSISFDRFGEPLAITLRMVADIGMYSGYMSGDEKDELFAGVVGIVTSGLYQASFLQGVESIVKVFQGDTNYALGQAIQNYTATQTPFGGLLAYVDRVADPYKSAYEGGTFTDMLRVTEDAFGTGIFGKLAARVPGLGSAPQLIDQLTGRPIPIVPGVGPGGLNALQMAIPVYPRNNSADAVWQAVFDIQGSYLERRPTGSRKITQAEQQKLNAIMATSRIEGKTLGERILAFRRRADVEAFVQNKGGTLSASKFKIERELEELIGEHYSAAKQRLMIEDSNVLQRERYADARDLALSNNDVKEADRLGGELDDLFQRSRRGY